MHGAREQGKENREKAAVGYAGDLLLGARLPALNQSRARPCRLRDPGPAVYGPVMPQ
jgi:hypothetical protein